MGQDGADQRVSHEYIYGQSGSSMFRSIHQTKNQQSFKSKTQSHHVTYSINYSHLLAIQDNKVLFLSDRYLLRYPESQKYHHMIFLTCCPTYHILSFTTVCVLAYLAQFIAEVSTGFNSEGSLLLIQEQSIIKLGGNVPFKIRDGEVWRLIVSSLLHYDFLHFIGCIVATFILFSSIEHTLGHLRSALFYFTTTIAANIFTALCQPNRLKIGGSPFSFSTVGFLIGYLLVNWSQLDLIGQYLKGLMVILIFFLFGLIATITTPFDYIDYFGPIGGIIAGIWATCICEPIYPGKKQKLIRIIFLSFLLIQYIVTFTLFYTLELEFD